KAKAMAVSDQSFRKEVLKSKKLVLVDFWAPWCGPCRSIAPFVEQLADEYKGELKVVKLDTERSKVMPRRYQIQSIPTFILFEGGQPVARMSGGNPGSIRAMVERGLGK
ncbi:MAG: thioredoxin, partial [Aggregatilineales bacterium]